MTITKDNIIIQNTPLFIISEKNNIVICAEIFAGKFFDEYDVHFQTENGDKKIKIYINFCKKSVDNKLFNII